MNSTDWYVIAFIAVIVGVYLYLQFRSEGLIIKTPCLRESYRELYPPLLPLDERFKEDLHTVTISKRNKASIMDDDYHYLADQCYYCTHKRSCPPKPVVTIRHLLEPKDRYLETKGRCPVLSAEPYAPIETNKQQENLLHWIRPKPAEYLHRSKVKINCN